MSEPRNPSDAEGRQEHGPEADEREGAIRKSRDSNAELSELLRRLEPDTFDTHAEDAGVEELSAKPSTDKHHQLGTADGIRLDSTTRMGRRGVTAPASHSSSRSIEDELELVPPKESLWSMLWSKRQGYRKEFRAVGTLYLEDLERIYRAIDSTLDDEKAEQLQTIQQIRNWRSQAKESTLATGDEYVEQPFPEAFTRPLIGLSNEEYKFKSMEQVKAVPRVGFRQFKFDSVYPGIDVEVTPGKVEVSTYSDDDKYSDGLKRIETIIGSRQNRIMRPIYGRFWLVASFIFFPVFVVVIALSLLGTIDSDWVWAFNILIYGYWVLRALPWAFFGRRRYSVVPKYEVNVHRTFWEKNGASIATIATIIASIVAILAWLFPRT